MSVIFLSATSKFWIRFVLAHVWDKRRHGWKQKETLQNDQKHIPNIDKRKHNEK